MAGVGASRYFAPRLWAPRYWPKVGFGDTVTGTSPVEQVVWRKGGGAADRDEEAELLDEEAAIVAIVTWTIHHA